MTQRRRTNCLGFPRIGKKRELKRALESYWAGKTEAGDLLAVARAIREENWKAQARAGIDLIASNDFSLYDSVLDASSTFGVIPERFAKTGKSPLDTYFAMARGAPGAPACAMTKWFDTNYHYIVPELARDTRFELRDHKPLDEYLEAKALGMETMPVLVGPVTYLSLAACAGEAFDRMEHLNALLPLYADLLGELSKAGAQRVRFDEPILSTDLDRSQQEGLVHAYHVLRKRSPALKIMLANYFGNLGPNMRLAAALPVHALHIDAVRAPEEVLQVARRLPEDKVLSAGIVDGRNIWRCDTETAGAMVGELSGILGEERLIVATSCSMLHVPVSLEGEDALEPALKNRLAFAVEKLGELRGLADGTRPAETLPKPPPCNETVKSRMDAISEADMRRSLPREKRLQLQRKKLSLPLLPTTSIGSFPQTDEVRRQRAAFRKGQISEDEYERFLMEETARCIRFQEETGMDVLVHGEFERTDMVEYFAEKLDGIAFTKNGWVQSYGSRCVKPPVIHADVSRREPMTLRWSRYAQSLADRPVKGMLTGPVTILKWSFPRNDQPLSRTAFQIALALRDEVLDLEQAGIRAIQIDEPGLREGLPLRANEADAYLHWAVDAFRLASAGVRNETQIHTHMCYARFDGIIEAVNRMDADVISIEAARSDTSRLDAFSPRSYGGEVGPGVWDIHSPRVPPTGEMLGKLLEAAGIIGAERLWANPDCGLKTRAWPEVRQCLAHLVEAAQEAREKIAAKV